MPRGRPPGRGRGSGTYIPLPTQSAAPAAGANPDALVTSSAPKATVPLFDSSNYHVWAFNMRCFLLAEGSFGAIDELSNGWLALTPSKQQEMQYRAFNWMRVALGGSFVYVCGEFQAHESKRLWEHVQSMFVKNDLATRLKLEQRFQNIYWNTSKHHVDSFLQELYLLRMEHRVAGFPLTDEVVFAKLLLCLPAEFDIEKSQMKEWANPDLAWARKILKDREDTLLLRREASASRPLDMGTVFVASSSSSASGASASSKVNLGPKRPAVKCFYCKCLGHRIAECRKRMQAEASSERSAGISNLSKLSGTNISPNFQNRPKPRIGNSTKSHGGSVSFLNAGDDQYSFFECGDTLESSGHDRGYVFTCESDDTSPAKGETLAEVPEDGFIYMMADPFQPEHDFIIDTGATHSICKEASYLTHVRSTDTCLGTGLAGATLKASKCGSLLLDPRDKSVRSVLLEDALLATDAATNIIAIKPFIQKGCSVVIHGRRLSVMLDEEVVLTGEADEKGLYHLVSHSPRCQNSCLAIRDIPKSDALRLLHVRLGHLNVDAIKTMVTEGMVDGIPKDLDFSGVSLSCPHCLSGKATRLPYPSVKPSIRDGRDPLTMRVGDELVSDSFGPITPISRNGNRHVVEFIDVASRFAFMFAIPSLDHIVAKFVYVRNLLQTQCGVKIRLFHCDGHGSYASSEFLKILEMDGTLRKIRAPYCPEQNAIAERRVRTVVEMARTMLLHSCIPIEYWEDAVYHANYVRNRVATRSIKGKTPFEVLWGKRPDLEWLRPFGCLCYVLIHDEIRDGKFSARSLPGVLLGMSDQHSAYKILLLGSRQVKIARDVRFYEDIFPFRRGPVSELQWLNPEDCPQMPEHEPGVFQDPFMAPEALAKQRNIDMATLYKPSPADLLGGPLPPSIAGNAIPTTLLLRSDIEGVGESDGERQSLVDLVEGMVMSMSEISPDDALRGPDAEMWREAYRTEFDAINRTGTFVKLDDHTQQLLTEGKIKVHRTRPVLTVKRDEKGEVARYKVRLVVQGYTMRKGIDYDNTYSPCARLCTVRIVVSAAATNGWKVWHADVPNAYLNGSCPRLVLVQLPALWNDIVGHDVGRDGEPAIMANSLYGAPDAGRNWNKKFTNVFVREGYGQSPKEPCLFTKHTGAKYTIFAIWVDDCFITGSDDNERARMLGVLVEEFNIKMLGPVKYALGIRFDQQEDGIRMTQSSYIEKIAERFGLTNARPVSVPLQKGFRAYKAHCPVTDEQKADMANVPYRGAVGSLLYAALSTRPDIAYAVCSLARFSHNPGRQHWAGVKSVIRYLYHTRDRGLNYRRGHPDLDWTKFSPNSFSDASYNDSDDGRSTIGFAVFLNDHVVSWKTKLPKAVAQSVFEAEWHALNAAARESSWVCDVLVHMHGKALDPVRMYVDNKACLERLDDGVTDGNKHFRPKYFYVLSLVKQGDVSVLKISSEENTADILTKALGPPQFQKHVNSLGVE